METFADLPTRGKILDVAMHLFAERGFADLSVREIASAVGIKASSLYKHYRSKEDILDHIFNLFREKFVQAADFTIRDIGQALVLYSPETFLASSFEKFKHAMWTPEVIKMVRIITLEQQRNPSVRAFFARELVEKPNEALQSAFDFMVEKGMINPIDTKFVAEEYNAYIVYLYFEQNFLSERLSFEEIERKMKQHNAFYCKYVLVRKEEYQA